MDKLSVATVVQLLSSFHNCDRAVTVVGQGSIPGGFGYFQEFSPHFIIQPSYHPHLSSDGNSGDFCCILQNGREISVIIVTDDYMCYKQGLNVCTGIVESS